MDKIIARSASFFDFLRLGEIVVDDRKNFDNPLFINGEKPVYSTWKGLKPYIKFFSNFFNPKKQIIFLECNSRIVGAAVTVGNLIDGFFINREFRGMGLGKRLMEHTFWHLRKKGHKKAIVGVQSKNFAAKSFYKKCGFNDKETRMEMGL